MILKLFEAASYGRVVELVDSLDSGSSVHCGRAGSSPASPTKSIEALRFGAFLFSPSLFVKINLHNHAALLRNDCGGFCFILYLPNRNPLPISGALEITNVS